VFTRKAIKRIIHDIQQSKVTTRQALSRLKNLPYESFPFAKIDHHRHFRKGFPEAVYAPGKTLDQLVRIIQSIQKSGQNVIVTRLEDETWTSLKPMFPALHYSKEGRIAYGHKKAVSKKGKPIAILTAGTSDLPVAEEAALTLELVGRKVNRFYDCGIAGLHRLVDQIPKLEKCDAIICIAGMEGALASVVAGLVTKPVVAVPTSVGYGANFKGIGPLLTMLNSCAQGVAVVNIDNGFGAACFASLVTRKRNT